MKKSFIIAAFAALTLTACNNSEKSSTDNNSSSAPSSTAPAINQDSIDKAHGHS
ncbi:lipoprotein, partial [Sphingobacterium sp. UBA2096]